MRHLPHASEPQSLYELAWNSAPGSMFAFESGNGTIINVNPAAEAFSGYSRKELLGLNIAMMHPESERDLVLAEFLRAEGQFSSEVNLHIKHKDGHCVPVVVSTSKSSVADGRDVVVCIYRDISLLQKYEHHLITQRWALAAYAGAALALWQKHKPESLLQAMCKAITHCGRRPRQAGEGCRRGREQHWLYGRIAGGLV